ncbi:hypothetical protein D7Y13_20850 [Corallococcus praedator]|uniref:Lipoprotein n=1 Tax=Corallococcus praedator TaxID=2316724 RepID=A0ABX9QF02_9BACT|nr:MULTISPECIES: hypothetical protein [Corallococcus]RKH26318.1 hypothetical protein D7X75_28580 [Corallococcus sp. CA031C]RKI06123.1 hypothetical protein D7Y13_20850 [Corallococcus praedator]
MNQPTLLLMALSLTGCGLFQRPFRPEHAPPAEAAAFQFPLGFPPGEHTFIPSTHSAAVQLAMDDFLPRDARPPRNATPDEVCLMRRESYDVLAKNLSEDVVLVAFTPGKGVCASEGLTLDLGATYAVDVRGWRILAVQR